MCRRVCLCVSPSVDALIVFPQQQLAVHHGSHPIQRCTVGQLKARLCVCVCVCVFVQRNTFTSGDCSDSTGPLFRGPGCGPGGWGGWGGGRRWGGVTPPTPPLKEILNTVSAHWQSIGCSKTITGSLFPQYLTNVLYNVGRSYSQKSRNKNRYMYIYIYIKHKL